mgnify:CR=1 FL=1
MGQFSWIYSDTNKQLIDKKFASTYLLVPKPFQEKYGKAIYEEHYDGYGRFGKRNKEKPCRKKGTLFLDRQGECL